MIRLPTCVSVLLAFGSGLYLYQTKHQAQVLDRQIEHTVKTITQTRAQTRELTASWTLLGSPDRLQDLSDQFLGIKPVLPSQFVAMADLDTRLPAPRILEAPSSGALPSGAPTSAGPDATGLETAPTEATEAPDAPDTATTPAPPPPAPNMPAPTIPVPTLTSPATRTMITATTPSPPPSVPPSYVATGLARTLIITATTPIPATETARAQAAETAHPADRKPVETPHPGQSVAQPRPSTPRPANPPLVAALDRSPQSASPRVAPGAAPGAATAPANGSLLGMARIAVRAPVPLPVNGAPFVGNRN